MTKEREALKLALEALEDNQHYVADNERHAYVMEYNNVIEKCKEALAQPKEKVDWEKLYRLEVKKKDALAAKYERDIKPLTKIVPMAQPEQEPVATWENKYGMKEWQVHALRAGWSITPPQRTWMGLTDEDLAGCTTEEYETARYWEAKLKEKNT